MAENFMEDQLTTNLVETIDLDSLSRDIRNENINEPLPKKFNLTKKFNFLVNDYVNPVTNKKGMSRSAAETLISKTLLKRAGVPSDQLDDAYEKIRNDGASNDAIISHFTGVRNPNDFFAFAEGAGRETTRLAPAFYLAKRGAKLGFSLNPIPYTPAKLVSGAIGGITGFLTGLFAGSKVEEAVFPETGVVPSAMPALETGRSVAGVVTGAPYALAAAKKIPEGVNFGAAKLLKNIRDVSGRNPNLKEKVFGKTGKVLNILEDGVRVTGQFARKNPKAFVVGEMIYTLPIGLGAAGAEYFAPGETGTRILSEIGTSMVFPQRLVVNAVPILKNQFSSVVDSAKNLDKAELKKSFARKSVMTYLDKISKDLEGVTLENYEEKLLEAILKYDLRDVDGKRIDLTPSQITGDPGLALLEKSYLQSSAKYGTQARQAASQGLKKVSQLLKALTDLDTPDSIKLAADLRENILESMFIGKLNRLGTEVVNATEKIAKTGSKREPSVVIKELIDAAIADWRSAERAAYNAIPNLKQPVEINNIKKTWLDILENKVIKDKTGKNIITPINPIISTFIKGKTDLLDGFEVVGGTDVGTLANQRAIDKVQGRILRDESVLDNLVDESPEVFNLYNQVVKKGSVDEIEQINTLMQGLLKNKKSAGAAFPDVDANIRNRLRKYAKIQKRLLQNKLEKNRLETTKVELPIGQTEEIIEQPTTFNEIRLFRSALLDAQRDAVAAGNSSAARFLDEFANAALKDLGVILKKAEDKATMGVELTPNEKALRNAYTISRVGNDIFSRTIVGDLTRKSKTGADVVSPELLSERIFSGSDDQVRQNLLELETAMEGIAKYDKDGNILDLVPTVDGKFVDPQDSTKFIELKTLADNVETRTSNFRDSIYSILKVLSDKAIKKQKVQIPKKDGVGVEEIEVVDEKSVKKFIDDNEGIFEIPFIKNLGLKDDILNANNRSLLLNAFKDKKSRLYKSNENLKLLQKTLEGDNPYEVISKILSSSTKVESGLNNMIRQINKIKAKDEKLAEQAKKGLVTTVMDWAITKASKRTREGDMYADPIILKEILTESQKGRKSIFNILKDANIIDDNYITKFNQLTDALDNILSTTKISQGIGPDLKPTPIEEAGAGVLGAYIGRQAGSGTIQVPQMASNFFKDLLVRGPKLAIGDTIEELLSPNEVSNVMFSQLIQEGLALKNQTGKKFKPLSSDSFKLFLARVFGAPSATVLPAGREITGDIVPSEIEEPQEVRPIRPEIRQFRPPVRETSPQVMTPPPSAPKTDMASRARFQQLFPMDIASQTMTQTAQAPVAPQPMRSGIGSLV
jgi:hypothetical protein|tara:strand:+ start:480 stop:4439 length:3960 start_codon:yes stop_codon:yes gene_type:complete